MNRIDDHAALRAAFAMGARIQAWHLDESACNSAQGRWDTLPTDREPAFSCPAHLYRVHPDDALAAHLWTRRIAAAGYLGTDAGAVRIHLDVA